MINRRSFIRGEKMKSRKKRILLKDYKPGGPVLMNWRNVPITKS